ncbi:hypothetical protein J4558_05985 [Leptolyngbya sp. 15MV]|nr:hypothetical protein J4558_05985 [Leptolyngbya sp. 15MV]
MKLITHLVGLAGAAGVAASASAGVSLRSLQFDVNNARVDVRDVAGQPTAFTGLSFTGSVNLSFESGVTVMPGLAFRDDVTGAFTPAAGYNGTLSAFSLVMNLSGGQVTGGSVLVEATSPSGVDRYTAALNAQGSVSPFIGGGFFFDAKTSNGQFLDDNYAGVAIPDFFAAQGGGGGALPGSLIVFRFDPTPNGTGYADADIWVSNVPAPGSAALLALGGLVAARRRR